MIFNCVAVKYFIREWGLKISSKQNTEVFLQWWVSDFLEEAISKFEKLKIAGVKTFTTC